MSLRRRALCIGIGMVSALLGACVQTLERSVQYSGRPADVLAPVAFMVGRWRTDEVDGATTTESWSAAGAAMLGCSITEQRDAGGVKGLKFWEVLSIVVSPEGVMYNASPQGRSPATPFPMVSSDAGRVVFENPAHDFPTRIVYWLDPDGKLHARIEGKQQGADRAEEWVYTRVRDGSR